MDDSNCFLDNVFFGDDETENLFEFRPIFKCFRKIGNSNRISSWKSKWLSDERIKPPPTSNNSRSLGFNYINAKIRVKFDEICLKQDKLKFNHKNVMNNYKFVVI